MKKFIKSSHLIKFISLFLLAFFVNCFSLQAQDKSVLPTPVVEEHPEWIEVYWEAWEIAETKVRHGTEENGLVDAYLDEGFNDYLFQWDTNFMMLFANYGNGYVPGIVSQDNFYRKQHPDGFIDRMIDENTGLDYHHSSMAGYTNPPLFAWAEWDYYQTTGDSSRFDRVLPVLDAYYRWCKRFRTSLVGMYWYNNWGSGMDNSPRPIDKIAGWVDYTAQQSFAAMHLKKMAKVMGNEKLVDFYQNERHTLRNTLNTLSWNEQDGYYWDVAPDSSQVKVKTAAPFWTLLAGIPDSTQAAKLVEHLKNPDEFYRPHLFPTLSADHPRYHEEGAYWLGSIWAPTNVMYIKGLQRYGYEEFATEAAVNHLNMITKVYSNTEPHTLWENYAPEMAAKGSNSRPNFVGWTGNGPITLLFENILGFRPDAPENTLLWRPTLTGKHGIRDLVWGHHNTTVIAQSRENKEDPIQATVTADHPFTLSVIKSGDPHTFDIKSGEQSITIP